MYSCTFKKRNLDRIIIKYIYIEYLAACTGRTTPPPRKHRSTALGSLSLHVILHYFFCISSPLTHAGLHPNKNYVDSQPPQLTPLQLKNQLKPLQW